MPSTGYTSIPPPQPSAAADSSSFRHTIIAAKRPWGELLDVSALSPPISLSDAARRIRRNLYHFRYNYLEVSLMVLFFSLIFGYHAAVIIALMLTLAVWSYFFIYRDGPPVVLDRTVDYRTLAVVLSAITLAVLLVAHVWLHLLVSAAIGGSLACSHAAIRAPEGDVAGDDDLESPYGPLLSGDNRNNITPPAGAFSLF